MPGLPAGNRAVSCHAIPYRRFSQKGWRFSAQLNFNVVFVSCVTLCHAVITLCWPCYVTVCPLWPLTASDCLAAVTDVSSADSPSPRAAVCTKNLSLTLPRDEGVWMPSRRS